MNVFAERIILQENRLLRWLNHGLRHNAFRTTMIFVSRLGDGVLWYSLAVALLLWQGFSAWRAFLAAALAIAFCIALFKALKKRTSRPRPFEVMSDLQTAIPPLDQWSFPSGHAMNAFAAAVLVQIFFAPLALIIWPMAVLIALSRIALGLHYPSDVVVGAGLGALLAGGASCLVMGLLSV